MVAGDVAVTQRVTGGCHVGQIGGGGGLAFGFAGRAAGGVADELGRVGLTIGPDPGGGEVGDERGLAIQERAEAFDVAQHRPTGGVVGLGRDPADSTQSLLWIEHTFDSIQRV